MGKKILKRMLSSLSATVIATTSLGLSSVLSASANNVPAPKTYDIDHSFADCFECEDHCSEHDHGCLEDHDHCDNHDCCDNSGEGVTIALLDAGVSAYETDGGVSFVNDDTVDSDHGNNMMSSLINIAPGASVLDVRVLDDEGKGNYSDVEKGIRWSVDNNAEIIVMSSVGEDKSALLEKTLEYAEENNVLVIASAGNYSSEAALYPAAYPTVISVGAVDENGDIQGYSNYGEYVDTYAQSSDGTSFAAQFVAGSAASMISEDHDIPVSEIRELYNSGKTVAFKPADEDNGDSVVYAAAACKSHNYKFYMTAKSATCTSNGVAIYKCSRCTSTQNRTVKAYGHSYAWKTTVEPTCTKAGTRQYKCTRSGCTYKEEEVIPQLGTLSVDDYSNSTFYFHADGSLEESAHSWPLQYQKSDNVFYLRLRFTSNVDWKISSTGTFVNFMDTNLKKISSGKSGTNEVIISLSAMPLTFNDESRNCSITITANDVSKKYNISQCNYIINGINKKTFINTGDIPKLISEAGSTSNAAKALRCEISLNKIEVYDFKNFRKLAVSSRKLDSSHFVVEYALFMANVTTKNDELWAEIELLENHGIKLTQNGTLFTTTATIKSSYADVKDEIYEDKVNRANLGVTLINDGLSLACSYFLPIKNKLASFAIGKGRGKLATGLGKMIVNSVYKSNGNTTVTTSSTVKIEGGCSFTNNTDEVNIFAYGSPDSIANAKSTISLNVVDTIGRTCSKTYSY